VALYRGFECLWLIEAGDKAPSFPRSVLDIAEGDVKLFCTTDFVDE